MSRIHDTVRAAGFTAGVALLVAAFASTSEGFQRPPPAKDPGLAEAHVGCLGHGKGEVVLPLVGEDGRMSGRLVDCEGYREFQLEALMTGCMPAEAVGERGYWFGGLYGKVWKLGGAPEPWVGAAASYGLQGTWRLFDGGEGTFTAEAVQFTPTGRLVVVGELHGKFQTDPERPLGATLTWGDARVPDKAVKSRYRDAASQPVDPSAWGDAASVPRKLYPKTPFGEARSKTAAQPFGDAASVPRKVYPKTRFGDAASQPVDPSAWGDAASVPRKATPKTPYGDAASAPDPWGDAASVPRKVYPKTPFGEARSKTADQPFGDAASVPRKVYPKTPFRDATTGPTPRQVGTFYLRFHFDV